MARILGSIAVSGSQFRHIILCTQDTGNDNLMQRNALDLQRIKIRPTDILQQYRSPRHQIRNTVVQLIHIKERIAAHIHQFTLAMLSLLTVLNRSHAMLAGSHNLYILLIREGISEVRHRENAMLHLLAILIEKYRKSAIRGCIRSYRQFILSTSRSHQTRSIRISSQWIDCRTVFPIRMNRQPRLSHTRKNNTNQCQQQHDYQKTLQISILTNLHN